MNQYVFAFDNNIYFILFSMFLFFLCVSGLKLKNNISFGISIEEANQLKGFFIVTVVLHHLSQRIVDPGVFVLYRQLGYVSVGMFFFLSGYGLAKSSQKNQTINSFLTKRITRVYLPLVIANIIFVPFLNIKNINEYIFNVF